MKADGVATSSTRRRRRSTARRAREPGRPRTPPLHPESPYGETKVVGEWLGAPMPAWPGTCRWVGAALLQRGRRGPATSSATTASTTSSRWSSGRSAEGRRPQIFGDDYPTPGRHLHPRLHPRGRPRRRPRRGRGEDARPGGVADAYNVGRGEGSSVREVMEHDPTATGPRRPRRGRRPSGRAIRPRPWPSTERIATRPRLDAEPRPATTWSVAPGPPGRPARCRPPAEPRSPVPAPGRPTIR